MADSQTPGPLRRIVVLGGGSAGWMSACYLAKSLPDVRVVVLATPEIPRIGVGEATIPNLQSVFFDLLGLSEDDWMPHCNASFKMGIKFVNWATPGRGEARVRDSYYHVFGLLREHDGLPLSQYWAKRRADGDPVGTFDEDCYWEPALMEARRGPRFADGTSATAHAWHFDANLLADFLARHATTVLGVEHVEDRMTSAVVDDRGFITALRTAGGRDLEGDLFVDCSGFAALLINGAMGEPFVDMGDRLRCNRAIASPVPYDDDELEPYTSSIAMSAGWTWKVPLLGRFGTGYVYSADFQDPDDAAQEFCDLWGLDPAEADLRHLRFRVGRNERAWVRNCVGIGLSSCFLEPLESTGLYFVYGALYLLVRHLTDRRFDPALIDRFNAEVVRMFDDSRDFLQTHYCLSPRTDTAFWRAQRELTLSDDVREKITTYRAGLPVNQPTVDVGTYYGNFEAELRNFWTNGSFYCVFAGLGVEPDAPMPVLAHRPEAVRSSADTFAAIAAERERMLRELPPTVQDVRRIQGVADPVS